MSLKLVPIFCNEKNMANYAYLIYDTNTLFTIIIDAPEYTAIKKKLDELGLTPSYILNTHHHFDHTEGNNKLKEEYHLKIIAPEDEFYLISDADIMAKDQNTLNLEEISIKVIKASGHTAGHVLYYIKDISALFTGDVLFNLCIGGLFEGTSEEMFSSLQQIKLLPDNTNIFPGHEYTRACLNSFILNTPNITPYINKMLLREKGELAPSTLAEEKTFNPYLKANTISEFLGTN